MTPNINASFRVVNDSFIFFQRPAINNPFMDEFSSRVEAYLVEAGYVFTDLYLLVQKRKGAQQKIGGWKARGRIALEQQDWVLLSMKVFDWRDWFRHGLGPKPPIEAVRSALGPLKATAGRGKRRPKAEDEVVVGMPRRQSLWPFTDEVLRKLAESDAVKVQKCENLIRVELEMATLVTAPGNSEVARS